MMELFNNFSNILENNMYLAPIIAFVGGVVASFSPCTFSQIPLLLMYLSSEDIDKDKNKVKNNNLKYTIIYSIGTIITFVLLAVISSLAGTSLISFGRIFYLICGILMLVIFLQMMRVLDKFSCKVFNPITKKKGAFGALITGVVGGVFSSPCSTPILISILAISAVSGNVIFSTFLLILYGLGHSILYVLVGGTYVSLEKLQESTRFKKSSDIFKIVFSIIILFLALYFIYLGFL